MARHRLLRTCQTAMSSRRNARSHSCIAAMNATNTSRYHGSTAIVVACAITPNNGGMSMVPTYANAICTPTIACDLSAPKYVGVEWMMHG